MAASQPGEVRDQERRQGEEEEPRGDVQQGQGRGGGRVSAGRWQWLGHPAGAVLRRPRRRVCSALGARRLRRLRRRESLSAGSLRQGACPTRGCLVAAKTPGARKKEVHALLSSPVKPRAGSVRGLICTSLLRALERRSRSNLPITTTCRCHASFMCSALCKDYLRSLQICLCWALAHGRALMDPAPVRSTGIPASLGL